MGWIFSHDIQCKWYRCVSGTALNPNYGNEYLYRNMYTPIYKVYLKQSDLFIVKSLISTEQHHQKTCTYNIL